MGGIGFHHTFHQLVASIEREMTTHLCTECGKSFTEEVLLLIHQTRIHDKTSYSCDECGADVIGKVSLSNHKRRHKIPAVKNLRKHKCEKCPYESEVKSNVNRHKKQVHEQKPDKVKKSWNCDKCEAKINIVRIPCVIGSEHSQSLLLLEFCDILDRCASEQMKII